MTCENDDTLGPVVRGCRGDFDFTILFEQTFFVLIPACLFIPLSLGSIAKLHRRPVVVSAQGVALAKLARLFDIPDLEFSANDLNS